MSDKVYLLIDVDGYCVSGCNQRSIVTPTAEGYRARELGWAYYHEGGSAAGSIYLADDAELPTFPISDASIVYTQRLHGLPVNLSYAECISSQAATDHVFARSTDLLSVIRILRDTVAAQTGRKHSDVIIVHKGGNEGYWATLAIPGTQIIDLTDYGCPPAATIHGNMPAAANTACDMHGGYRKTRNGGFGKTKKMVHGPALELRVLASWIAERGES